MIAAKKWPKVLAFDTSGPFCAIGLATESYSWGAVHDMARGQAEALFPLLEQELERAGWAWADLDAIGVSTGPGNFTGIRIAISAARGLGLSLGIPIYGVSNFEIAAYAESLGLDDVAISLPAPRGNAYVQPFLSGSASGPAFLADPGAPPADRLADRVRYVFGHNAEAIALHFGLTGEDMAFKPAPAKLAELAEAKYLGHDGAQGDMPSPLYIRAADAAPPREVPPEVRP